MARPVYLDNNASTPVDPKVIEAMLPYFSEHYGNASSGGHAYGWAADEAVKQAREQVAALIGADDPKEIVFTSGATEALSMAIRGIAEGFESKDAHIITVATEHRAVIEPFQRLERIGYDVTYLPVAEDGRVDPAAVEDALRDNTVLAAIMWANNETGVLHPMPEIKRRLRDHRVALLVDATQAAGKVPVDIQDIDLLACSAHKFYGPKGTGILYQKRGLSRRMRPLIEGGGQQDERRGGTLNVPGIVGMGAAATIALETLESESARLQTLRDKLEADLKSALPNTSVNGASAPRLPQTSSVTFNGMKAERLMRNLRGLALSSGSACSSSNPKPSHVLMAMGLSDDAARATLRFSLGRFTTGEDVEAAIEQVTEAAEKLKGRAAVNV